jgi:hypothetical protein
MKVPGKEFEVLALLVELYSLTIQLLLDPEGATTHCIHYSLEASLIIEIGELRLIALKKLDIRILQ